jgi:DNA segregation ATPase FtsK/SpoIIIE, S-DNA-T family
MQLVLTLCPRGAPSRDVELRAPSGATVGDVAGLLYCAAGIVPRPANQADDPGSSTRSGLWIGSRALPSHVLLERVGLRSGCLVGVDQPTPRVGRAHAAVRLHVVSGPDAGRVEPIARGQLRIGRDPRCHVQLSDTDVSRQHVELTVQPSGVSVRDLNSSNGTWILSASAGPTPVDAGGRELPLNSYLSLGETTLCITGVRTPPAATTSGGDGRVTINRSPRLDPGPPSRLDLPPDPTHERRPAMPWVAALLPALGGVGLAWFLHSPQFLAFALLSPLILLATAVSDRVSVTTLRSRKRAAGQRERSAANVAMASLAETEVAYRRHAHPDPAAVLVTATTPDARLWERRRVDPDFLEVRLGLGAAPARAVTRIGVDVVKPAILPGVPAVVSMRTGPLGISGPRPLALPLARWVIGQLTVLHSPADLRLAALLPDDADSDWAWLRWLPHVRTSTGALRIARSPQHRQRLVSELAALMDASSSATAQPRIGHSWTVVLVDRCSGIPDVGALARDPTRAATARITFVYLEAEARRLPAACATIAQLFGETGSRVRIVNRGDQCQAPDPPADNATRPTGPPLDAPIGGVTRPDDPVADRVGEQWCDQVARALAPLADPGAEQANDLPVSVRARDLYDLPDLTPNTIRTRWAGARGRAATPVGIGLDGPVEIDLGRDGPHALIAGTTGAGKSELLQALVTGLALHGPPAELQFVLIDYKGGAAFGECARLPHTVGMVTDLDGHLTQRALRSLEAELRRRERHFAQAGAIDLPAYRRTAAHAHEPIGRIVLVVDEFASLVEELPDFVAGLVGIAQRGRSLGVHLILATQRPAGVVSAEIRANTALRIALRVTDLNDSSDVIGSDLAAHIDRDVPGRAVVRVAQALFPVQIGQISTPAPMESNRVEVIALDRWGTPLTTSATSALPTDDEPTDLRTLVEALRTAWEIDPVRPRRPWLDPLSARLDLATLALHPVGGRAAYDAHESVFLATTVGLGLIDRPREQDQIVFALDLAEPTTMVFTGGPRSGRTSVLRTAAVCGARQLRADQLNIYAIDCAGSGLQPLTDLPHCGAVVTSTAPASIGALLDRLSGELDRRRQSATDPRGSESSSPEPALLLLLDGWEGFLAATEDLDAGRCVDTFLRLLRDGAAAGLTVLVAGDRSTLAARLSSAVQRRLVLRLSDPADYAVAGLSSREIPTLMPPGRAVDTADGSEIQFGIFGCDPSPDAQLAAVGGFVADAGEREREEPSARRPFVIRALPPRVRLDEIVGRHGPVEQVVLGVGGESGEPVMIRVGPASASGLGVRFLVAGPPRSGRSTVLRTIMIQLSRMPRLIVAAAGSRSPVIAMTRAHDVTTLDPDDEAGLAIDEMQARLSAGQPVTLLIDDTELFGDGPVGERLAGLIRGAPSPLDVFATGRVDDLALTFGGVAAEMRRARTGLLLQPGPGDGDLFGLRLPFHRSQDPPGRGLLVAPDLITGPTGSAALPLQVAQP